jgi:hypothetical protein
MQGGVGGGEVGIWGTLQDEYFFVVGQRQRKEWTQLDVSQLIYYGIIFVQTTFLKWQSSIRRFSHTKCICMSKKVKYPFMFFFGYLEGTLWYFFFKFH